MAWIMFRTGKPDPGMMANGMLAGLVAITAPCAFVAPWAAAVIGTIAGVLVIESVFFVERRAKVDDPVGAISVHGVCGAFGVLSVGIFANGSYGAAWNGSASAGVEGVIKGNWGQLGAQVLGVARDRHDHLRDRLRLLQDPERRHEGRHPSEGGGRAGGTGPAGDGRARLPRDAGSSSGAGAGAPSGAAVPSRVTVDA